MNKELDNFNENNQSQYDIEISNMTKKYSLKGKHKEIWALKNINLKVKKGEIFGLLGPNGAGKTTIISILTTLLQPTSGSAKVLGYDVVKQPWMVKQHVGLMFGGEMIYHRLTGFRNLKYFCKLYGIKEYKKKIHELAERLDLTKWLSQYVNKYSKGMKLKLALARVLLTEPKVLCLDEPMLGLDPNYVEEVIKLLKDLKKTIFLTSHQMDVVQKICHRIAFLKEGEIYRIDTKENFKKLIVDKVNINIRVLKSAKDLIIALNKLDFVSDLSQKTPNDIQFFIDNENYYPELFNYLKDYPIMHFSEKKPTLYDVFIKLNR